MKSDKIYDLRKMDVDGIEHHLIACPDILPFWNSSFKWWRNVMLMNFPIDTYDILFGIPNPNKDNTIMQLNVILLHALYYVYQRRRV